MNKAMEPTDLFDGRANTVPDEKAIGLGRAFRRGTRP